MAPGVGLPPPSGGRSRASRAPAGWPSCPQFSSTARRGDEATASAESQVGSACATPAPLGPRAGRAGPC
eukprot:3612265-Pyramimonas_sp.AAC.1